MSRRLKLHELANVFETSEAEAREFYRLADEVGPQICGDIWSPDMLRTLVNLGHAKVTTICDAAGVPSYVLCYGFTAQNWLFIHAFIALKASDLAIPEKAICDIATANLCPVVQGNILRKGLFNFLTTEAGWKPLGVVVTKKL